MSNFMSGSPEGDEGLPSFMEQRNKLSASPSQNDRNASADPSSSIPQRNSTLSPAPHASGHHHHFHGHSHNYAHGHGSCSSSSHSHGQQRTSTMMSNNSNSSLGVSGGSQGHTPSRSMTRTPSHEYRETLDAKSKNLEDGSLVINQYKITEAIGRGAFGTVRKAVLVDDPDVEFAVKDFGKTRLRKTHRADKLRKPRRDRDPRAPAGADRGNAGNNSDPTKGGEKHEQQDKDHAKDPLSLIRHEIAILKKLHHPHVVKLYEVLDDPSKDNLYMVFEFCPDGTVIDVKLNDTVEPLPEDVARFYFVQILMGIEYLHENEVVHRDIKPDNILLSNNRKTCKIVDFGVSEMFFKPGDDTMQKSAGSPAFMSPELCTAGHAEYHGKADDIWSFGVTLYCMVVGHLPFDRDNFYEMYEAIKNDEPEYPEHLSNELKDLLQKMLAKDPEKRITVAEMREHPWTLAVEDGVLLSKEANLEAVVSEITDEDLDCAICKITNIFTIARAIHRFKKGGSMQRARRGTSQASDGSSNHDSSWFPRSTDSPEKLSRSASKERNSDEAAKGLASVSTIKEESPAPASQEKRSDNDSKTDQGREPEKEKEDETHELQAAAAHMFESPQMHTFELPPEEPDGNGPLRRNHSGPITTLHKPEADPNGPPVINMDSPRSASPDVFASPTSEGDFDFSQKDAPEPDETRTQSRTTSSVRSADYSADTSMPDEAIATDLSNMMLEHSTSGQDVSDQKQRKDEVLPPKQKDHAENNDEKHSRKSIQERAASLGKTSSKPKPKLLPDQPTVCSPRAEDLRTPPGAADVYAQRIRTDDDGEGKDEGYFKVPNRQSAEAG